MAPETQTEQPPICDYEGSDYQTRFWGQGERAYEDGAEAVALRRLLPPDGRLLLEVGAGAGRNTPRYAGFERVVMMDYSTTQLEQAQQALGASERYIYVAANVYELPFVDGLFDAATMIRVIHHIADAPAALAQIRAALEPGGVFVLEYANKRNLKAIARYLLGKQKWNPFDKEQVEFIPLNFDFHPAAMNAWLRAANFTIRRQLAVSHFRLGWLKRNLPTRLLVGLDAFFQPVGAVWQYTPSMFVRAQAEGETPRARAGQFFKCPKCGTALGEGSQSHIDCPNCGRRWGIKNGIYNFKEALE